ncbi:MAG TPA: glutathione S-transferase N-terminal domain-containing protein [Candidatus Thiothrix moscowensis]|uniref:glutathione S-transferase N-terminal domain-containing protein n=1 Tax=unclassified Thiothrix TaxID=2636184 RepID=UPI001A2FEA0B|nr:MULTISPECIES: glutathione S-transferase N-terminal domain-containing protein [unclassified Thiothrix]MBJ6610751.1 glutathione S-transferase N-terminal domain-containing protein [Candidatus Thiothrix moscowensis]HRJ54618.1 glutathione S-transferase N-terminal domain-containing protein [Candidatus Thiothrix moscowensis]HRJ95014.1 glutathione S-transferase N-terminal domain-containing protein [Candidatus Thiothrix moscowensis]
MLTLYQFNSCPFCWKVKAFLNYRKIPYDVVEVTPFGMKELDFTDHKKVPVLKDDAEIVVESSAIVRYLNDKYVQLLPMPQDEEWQAWVDNTLVHYLPPLIHPNMGKSFQNFGLITAGSKDGAIKRFLVRFAGAIVMPRVANKMKLKHNIQNPAAEFQTALAHWVDNGLAGNAFYGGEQPGLVDTSVFGVLHSAHGMGILEQAATANPTFGRWYAACRSTMAA